MRTLLIASAAALLLAGASHASSTYYFAKSDTSKEAFRHDQVMCERAGAQRGVNSGRFSGNLDSPRAVEIRATKFNKRTFFSCMAEKGYRQDPVGYRTGRLGFFSTTY